MQKAVLLTEDGVQKQVYLLEQRDADNVEKSAKVNWKEHLYIGFLTLGTLSFAIGIYLTYLKIKAEK